MLPSRGFFKKNDCPFFEKGLCVRPHCHFRHRKKVVSENSSNLDSQDLLISESIADIPLVNSINSESVSVSSNSSPKNENQHSSNNTDIKEDQSSHDSLFAKLVNQSNPYEKINRHIPCAYTPTPQIRSVQPKKKINSGTNDVNNFSVEISGKNQTVDSCYKSVNNKETENQNKNLECNNNPNSQHSTYQNKISFSSQTSNQKKFDNKFSDLLSYEPQLVSKPFNCDLNKVELNGNISSYVPSKVITEESKYTPNNGDSSLLNNYVPSKDKPQQIQYVPEPSGCNENQIIYKPSDKNSSKETQYQPDCKDCVTDYIPTEKSSTKSNSAWLDSKSKKELTEFEFTSSEIEMMKELLKDEINNSINNTATKTDLDENQEKKYKKEKIYKEKDKSSRSHHSSSSKHKNESSCHSSKSKHSSSSNFQNSSHTNHSSRQHHSSKHHSSSKSRKSSKSHQSSSERHRKTSSSSHKKSKHHSSSSRSSSTYTLTKKDKDSLKKEKYRTEKTKIDKCVTIVSDDEICDIAEEIHSEVNNSELKENSELENKISSVKRKNIWSDKEQKLKLLKAAEVDDLFDDLEDDPDTVEKQCLEIFNTYSKTETENDKKLNEVSIPMEEYESTIQGKKRTAHSTTLISDHSVLRHKTARKIHNIRSAQEIMLERYKTIEKAKETSTLQSSAQPSPILGLNRPSIKIAAVSNIQQMLQAKKAIQEKIKQGLKVNERTTVAQTVSHGGSRVAHTPAVKNIVEKPTVTTGSKQVPCFKRQIYLDKLLMETNKIYPTKEESAEEALKLEQEVFKSNSGSWSAYHAAFVSMLLKTKRRVSAVKGETSHTISPRPKMSHYDVLSGGKKNFSVIKTKKVDITMLTDRHIYEELLRCKLTPEELKENSYPMEGKGPGYAICSFNFDLKYNDKYLYIKKLTGNRRYCIRCSKEYEVDPVTLKQYKEGPETCCYHPGKKKSGGRNCDRIYNCCNTSSTEGCATHIRHVTDCNDYENLPNCVKTLSKNNLENPGIFALDCEMVYTRLGYELARVTVVNLKKEIVYDTLVKPKYPIDCYNTFYSGIEENMMKGVETTLKDVQAVLLSLFSDKTILIGHSLDSDLRALHLIHGTVVDTAIVYKNEKYHPYKYSLKDLCAKKISKIIQDNVTGHDSAEDAIAALEIMLNHVKEEVGKYDSLESYEADRVR